MNFSTCNVMAHVSNEPSNVNSELCHCRIRGAMQSHPVPSKYTKNFFDISFSKNESMCNKIVAVPVRIENGCIYQVIRWIFNYAIDPLWNGVSNCYCKINGTRIERMFKLSCDARKFPIRRYYNFGCLILKFNLEVMQRARPERWAKEKEFPRLFDYFWIYAIRNVIARAPCRVQTRLIEM